jgi:acyl carrier protein
MPESISANADPGMSRVFDALAPLLRAHAPALTSASRGTHLAPLDPALALCDDLGFDVVALAELAVAIEDALGIDVDVADLAGCPTVRDLGDFIAAGPAHRAL